MNTTSTTATAALHAYDAYQRDRRRRGLMDRVSDAMLAVGALLVVNVVLPLGFNLPSGRAALIGGAALIAASIAWMKRPARGLHQTQPERQLATVTPIYSRHARSAA